LRTLDESDIPYLRALLENDSWAIDEHEELARQFGYGPRVPCAFSASPSAQKELCRECENPSPYFMAYAPSAYWHRQSGKLARGVLQREKGNCPATFDIYTPYDLFDCPRVAIICRNPHSTRILTQPKLRRPCLKPSSHYCLIWIGSWLTLPLENS
jgi:hypothetical protein